jgi:hypothetical protein
VTDGRAWPAFRIATGSAAVLLLLLTWPLWTGADDLPAVPFVSGTPVLPAAAAWGLFVAALLAWSAGASGWRHRPAFALAAILTSAMVVQDQHRFQPWAYQFVLLAAAAALRPPAEVLPLARLLTVGIYLHSGLSKLDVSFVSGTGRMFLGALAGLVGADAGDLPPPVAVLLILAMPAGEIALAAGLCFPRTRTAAAVGAVLQHGLLIAALGPWALDHSAGVLAWNAYFVAAVPILFGPRGEPSMPPRGSAEQRAESGSAPDPLTPDPSPSRGRGGQRGGPARRAPVVWFVFAAAVLLPFGERWGVWDAWPSWALYAGHDERTYLYLPMDDAPRLPADLRGFVVPAGEGELRFDLTALSRARRWAPPYPANRAQRPLADWVAGRCPDVRWRLVLLGRAEALTGKRSVSGLPAHRP